jgi:hypothetical protein
MLVSLLALFGDRSPHGSPRPDGAPRSKNLRVLLGTVRVRTTRSGRNQRVIPYLGAIQYRYELSINEVFSSATGIAYENYRLPITMSDAVLARCDDLLVDGQRVAVLGPIRPQRDLRIDRTRIYAHPYGNRREMIDRYTGVSLRCRELLAEPRGAAARAGHQGFPDRCADRPA